MSRKKRKQMEQEARRAGDFAYRPMDGYSYPVAPASQVIQLPPIVQPIVMVPFASQQQPLATFVEEEDDDDFDF